MLRRIERNRILILYSICDYVTSLVAWFTFWFVRKKYIETGEHLLIFNTDVLLVSFTVSALWIFIYRLNGLYNSPYKRSRIIELGSILQATLIGVLIITFTTFLDDPIDSPKILRKMVLSYACIHFFLSGIVRFIVTSRIKYLMSQKKLGFRTVIVGQGERALKVLKELQNQRLTSGYLIEGYIKINDNQKGLPDHLIKCLGKFDDLAKIIKENRIEEMIIGLEDYSQEQFLSILSKCKETRLPLNVVPDMYDYIVGNVKMNNVSGAPFIEIYPHIISPWESVLKRLMDVLVSFAALIICMPIFIILAILIKLDSSGPILYLQQRIGKNGAPFTIIKFRSMKVGAENGVPSLSSDHDPRITRIGKFMRKTRLDEFPQFYNVLIGEMSLVGPRPERQFFIDQIVERAPEYLNLLKVKPGITSLGQVKFGYAENVDQMVERLQIDLLYIENVSIALDLKIMALTFLTVLKSEGK